MEIKFTVLGEAMPWQRVTWGKYGNSYVPEETRHWKLVIQCEAEDHKPTKLLDGPLAAETVFYLTRPKSRPKKHKYPDRKPDADNLEKSIYDALEGIIYKNDSRIVDKTFKKRYGDPRVEITIKEVAE